MEKKSDKPKKKILTLDEKVISLQKQMVETDAFLNQLKGALQALELHKAEVAEQEKINNLKK